MSSNGVVTTFLIIFTIIALVFGLLFGIPQWRVWQQGLEGEARLARAEQEKKIQIEQAKAEVESASLRAEAIELVGKAAAAYPEYRLQEFIGAFAVALEEGNIEQIIYVPTESNIPIMEATRLGGGG